MKNLKFYIRIVLLALILTIPSVDAYACIDSDSVEVLCTEEVKKEALSFKLHKAISSFKAADYDSANKKLAEVVALDKPGQGYFVSDIIWKKFLKECQCEDGLEQNLTKWVEAIPNSPYPYSIRAEHYIAKARAAIGVKYSDALNEHGFSAYDWNNKLALEDINKAIELDGQIAFLSRRKLSLLQMHRNDILKKTNDDLKEYYNLAKDTFPLYSGIHSVRLNQIKPDIDCDRIGSTTSRYGSYSCGYSSDLYEIDLEAYKTNPSETKAGIMLDFADRLSKNSPKGRSRMHTLPLNAYSFLASVECNDQYNERITYRQCDKHRFDFYSREDVKNELYKFIDRFDTSDFSGYYYYHLRVSGQNKKFQKTAELLINLLEQKAGTDNYVVQQAYGHIESNKGNHKKALEHYKKALAHFDTVTFEPEFHEALDIRATLNRNISWQYFKLKQHDLANEHIDVVLSIVPASQKAHARKCSIDYARKDHVAVIKSCRDAYNVRPQNQTLRTIANAHRKIGENDQAIKIHEDIIATTTKEKSLRKSHTGLGKIYQELGDYQKSVEHYTKAFEVKKSGYKNAYMDWSNRCWSNLKARNYEAAVKDCDYSLSLKKTEFAKNTKKEAEKHLK